MAESQRASPAFGWLAILAPVLIVALGIIIGARLSAAGLATPRPGELNIFYVLFVNYDVYFAGAVAGLLALAAVLAMVPLRGSSGLAAWIDRLPIRWVAVGLIVGLPVLSAVLGSVALLRYPLSMDEFGMLFIADLFPGAEASVPADWRGVASGATPTFVHLDESAGTWRSHYLPVLGVVLGVVRPVLDPWLVNPVLFGVSIGATYATLRVLVPDSRIEVILPLALFATSAQVVIVAGSMYAMTGHLAANAVWLWMTVARGPRSKHLRWLRPVVGFVAMGLHNPLPHLLFAFVFCVRDVRERRWALAAWHLIAYVAALWFWLGWFAWSKPDLGGAATTVLGLPGSGQWLIAIMAATALIGWLSPPLVPLAILGVTRWRSLPPVARDAAWALLLTAGAYLLFTLDQGHGWGHRYLHGSLVALPVLAAFGLRSLRGSPRFAGTVTLSVAGLAVGLVVLLPGRAWQVHRVVAPFEAVTRHIGDLDADAVVVDAHDAWYVSDQVRNRPGLTDRPVVLERTRLTDAQLQALSADRRVVFVGPEVLAEAGMVVAP